MNKYRLTNEFMSIRLTNEWMTNKPGSKDGWVSKSCKLFVCLVLLSCSDLNK